MELNGKNFQKMNEILNKFKEQSFDVSKSNYPLELDLDPFKIIEEDIEKMNTNIINNVQNKHPILSLMAQYYFKTQGKQFRPVTVLLTAKATLKNKKNGKEITSKHVKLAEIIQMIHTASLVHDDVIDNADTRRSLESINQKFGNKLSVLVGKNIIVKKKKFFLPKKK